MKPSFISSPRTTAFFFNSQSFHLHTSRHCLSITIFFITCNLKRLECQEWCIVKSNTTINLCIIYHFWRAALVSSPKTNLQLHICTAKHLILSGFYNISKRFISCFASCWYSRFCIPRIKIMYFQARMVVLWSSESPLGYFTFNTLPNRPACRAIILFINHCH